MKYLLPCFIMTIMFSGCGEKRRYGDTDGVPVTITAEVERVFFNNMENRQGRPSAGVGISSSSHGRTSTGVGIGLSFSSTQVYLVGGDDIGHSNVFVKEVKWGVNSFTVPLTPGRTLHVTAIAEGGRRGWEAIGTVTIPAKSPSIHILLSANGAHITTSEKPEPTATSTP